MTIPRRFMWQLCLAAAASACTGRYESDFPVLVANRTPSPIEAMANGSPIGQVEPGQTGSFTLKLPESNANVFSNGVAPTPQANVAFTARDTRTGNLSAEKNVVLTSDTATSIAFAIDDFPSALPTVARFTYSPTNPTINQEVSFNGSSSSATNGTFVWDFGDGESGSGVTTTHRYLRGGTFTITITVTSDTRQTSTSSRTITVATTLPATTANFTFSPTSPGINQDVVFSANATVVPGNPGGGGGGGRGDGPGTPVPGPGLPIPPGAVPFPGTGGPGTGFAPGGNYAWDFGDGTTANGTTVTHRFTRGGTFAVTLRVTSDAGLTATSTRQITVSTTLPAGSANFVFSPTDPHTGDTVFFNASSSTLINGTFAWDFGDGTRGTGVMPTHSYGQARTYTVTLTVRNDLGQSATTSKTVTVVE